MQSLKILGLTSEEVKQREKLGQVNKCNDNISKTKKQIFIEHTFTYFNFLNLFLAFIILSTGKWMNLTFMAVIIVNTVVGIFQEFKVKKIIDQLNVVTIKKVKVIRNQKLTVIPVEELVLDDVVYLENGNQIGTDCEVIESHGMEVNESLLTGESHPVNKQKGDYLLSGSFVVAGSAYAKVMKVGQDNYASQLVFKAKHKNKASSEMRDAIKKVIKVLSFVIVPVGLVLFISQMKASPQDQATAIVKTVAGVVGMIPEGLVLLTSLSFIIGVGKLAKKKALIQEMEAIEALARVNVLCLDKTGTITTGDLEVQDVICMNHYTKDSIDSIMSAMSYCFDDVNATQEALRRYFHKLESYDVAEMIPFSSERKMRILTYQNQETYALGAPEYLTTQKEILDLVNQYSMQGLRVLLLGKMNKSCLDITTIKTAAIIVLRDCIREDAYDTLAFFKKADVDIRILSGDNPITVSRVASIAGLEYASRYIDASTLPNDEEEFKKVASYYHVFGRVKPEQKQMLIKTFQEEGKVVGMVGDGVNDVLALKDADCGIAMAKGSDAAKQAAHIVLLDSQFSSMKDIVEEGRAIIADIERVSSLYLNKTIYSTALCLIFAVLRLSYPFTPLQLSLISGLAIGIPSFLLTLERSAQLSSVGFLKHVISTAVPCALTMITYMLVITGIGQYLHWTPMMYSTYYYLVAGFISFLVVYVVCMPLNHLRTVIICVITTLFYVIVALLHNLFGIYSLLNINVIGTIPLCISSVFVLLFYKKLIHNLYKLRESYKMHR